jgi:16S rRNA (cytidine1402-2'-O)-methyltransferase
VRKLLEDALAVFGDRPAAVAKELTKIHETVRRGLLSELLANFEESPKGEFGVLVAGKDAQGEPDPDSD